LYIQTALQQIPGISGPQTAAVIQKEIFVHLCDYRCKGEEMHEPAVPINAELVCEKRE
jgi:hypothetical protein